MRVDPKVLMGMFLNEIERANKDAARQRTKLHINLNSSPGQQKFIKAFVYLRDKGEVPKHIKNALKRPVDENIGHDVLAVGTPEEIRWVENWIFHLPGWDEGVEIYRTTEVKDER